MIKSHKLTLLIALFLYSIVGLRLFQFYRYQINIDGISYITIAQKYLQGDLKNAINGYWGPLLSWLLIPFIYLRFDPLIAVRILLLIIGFGCIIATGFLMRLFNIASWFQKLILFLLVPIILSFAFEVITPDLLVVFNLTWYCYFILNPNYNRSIKYAVGAGISAGLGYLSKSYILPFFLVHFLLFSFFWFSKSKTREKQQFVFINTVIGLSVFLSISLPWIYLISRKYHRLTFSTSGRFIYAMYGPNSKGNPMHYQGFIKPPNKSAINAWEDPSYFQVKQWNPLRSLKNLKYQIDLMIRNFFSLLDNYHSYYFTLAALVILLIYFMLLPWNKHVFTVFYIYPLITIAIYSIGYFFVLTVIRYFWNIYIMLLLMAGQIISIASKKKLLSKYKLIFVSMILLGAFLINPLRSLLYTINTKKDIYDLSLKLKKFNIRGNIASNSNYATTSYISYYLNSHYYGEEKVNNNAGDLEADLNKYKINYFFVWDKPANFLTMTDKQELSMGTIKNLKIYLIKKND